ncbi:phytanoyl-CoA dioxygenase family protein [Oricola cellulosilytica]|uniref:Phytanoyl-CoA dioxygenase n=1 Tax=Oricola cellulosilytica TaxID=1429082 RepID=A0A4R0PFV8_9HYPH|nr:phytanoyl-CoA dioxygenase family protein [Oricola cellulosilytica]TCD14374.1 phytanoyl-CoA dioxygenase [Oricola cellulosilytica]
MDAVAKQAERTRRVWLSPDSGDFDTFKAIVERTTDPAEYPLAATVSRNVPIYDGSTVRNAAEEGADAARGLMAEWVEVFANGPGVVVISGAFADTGPIDRATAIFETIIAQEKARHLGGGDHFAKPGANARIWNALEKHCLADPQNFAAYYGNVPLGLVCEAWLGPAYQMTAQVNVVYPGGEAQKAHRDYHLGFMTPEQIARYPAHVHTVSPVLTLQGAVAHADMPVESGPTLFLPYSQTFFEGYLAFGRDEFQRYFEENYVQLPLKKGDAVFFNPALMHGAGANFTKDISRMANLLQISSAFGRAMETVDRTEMVARLYPVLSAQRASGKMASREIDCVIAASAEGYPFPTNLDLDPPVGGLAPLSQAERVRRALADGRGDDVIAELRVCEKKRRSAVIC